MAAVPAAEPVGTPIKSFFRPSTRLHDIIREQVDNGDALNNLPEEFTEIVELVPHCTLLEILPTGTMYVEGLCL